MKILRIFGLFLLIIATCFTMWSCSGDDDDDMPPLDHNDVLSITVYEESSSVAVIAIEYYYTQNNNTASIGAMPLDEEGNWLSPGGFAPQTMTPGYGNAAIEVMYSGENPVFSDTIQVFMFTDDYFDPFYTESFAYSKTWMGF